MTNIPRVTTAKRKKLGLRASDSMKTTHNRENMP